MNTAARLFGIFCTVCLGSMAHAGWQKLQTPTTQRLNCITAHHALNTGKVWACGDQGVILYSSNGGDSWVSQSSGTYANLYTITFKEVAGSPVFAAGENGIILRTTNDGATWTPVQSGTTATLRDHSDFSWLIVGDSGVILRSTDNGISWSRRESGTTARLLSVCGAAVHAVGERGTIVRGLNGGETWQIASSGMDETLFGVPMFGNLNYIVGGGGLILQSSNAGAVWNIQQSRTSATLRSVEFSVNNTSRIYAVGDYGTIIKTTDGGATWGRQSSPTRAHLRSVFFYLNDNLGYVCGDSGVILRTTDGGGTFLPVPDSLADMFPLGTGNRWQYAHSWFSDDLVFGSSSSFSGTTTATVLAVSRAADSTRWTIRERVEGLFCHRLIFPPYNDTCFARQDSATFELIERHEWRHRLHRIQPYDHFSAFPFNRNVTDPGFFYRYGYPDSAAVLHMSFREPPEGYMGYSLVFKMDSGLVSGRSQSYITGGNLGSSHRLLSGVVTRVPEERSNHVPAGFSLKQNYPNPFNPTTNIEFQLANREFVSLKVFDVLGREVATLVDEVKNSGGHSVQFDASGFSSGVYYYRLQAGDYFATKKMLLIR